MLTLSHMNASSEVIIHNKIALLSRVYLLLQSLTLSEKTQDSFSG